MSVWGGLGAASVAMVGLSDLLACKSTPIFIFRVLGGFFCFWVWGDALGQPRVVPPTLRALTMFGSSWIRRSPRFARSSCSASPWIQLLTGKRARAERNAVQNSSGRHSTGEQMQEERGPRAHTRRIKAREIWGPFTQLAPCRALFFWMRTSKAFSQQTPS